MVPFIEIAGEYTLGYSFTPAVVTPEVVILGPGGEAPSDDVTFEATSLSEGFQSSSTGGVYDVAGHVTSASEDNYVNFVAPDYVN